MRTDGRTDMTRLAVAVRSFANVPKNALQIEEISAKNNHLPVADTKRNNHLPVADTKRNNHPQIL